MTTTIRLAPENYKGSVTAGATGNGGSNYTGSRTRGNRTVTPCRLYQIGDLVWNDANGDGLQSAGGSGLGSVQVNLFSAVGVLLDSTSSQASGPLLGGPQAIITWSLWRRPVTCSHNPTRAPIRRWTATPTSVGQTPVFTLGASPT
ncbi:SdrD B-like domain-containing protein [Candidatus Amarolinea dominans]|uniref:SdrD B-like domain-containing protein n=1 Tax=Candidatus Amarolinea dominans TaxID=3140696 RepID=UPI001E109416|nr:hypothetical protein [Anaerolineae bacterium]